MSLEASIQSLATAIASLAIAIQNQTNAMPIVNTVELPAQPPTEEPAKRGRGRPPGSGKKPEATPASPEDFPSVEPTKTSPQPMTAEAPVLNPPPAPAAAPAAELSRAKVQEVLIEVVKQHGRDACGALCRKYGGPNLSALDPAVWPALVADARTLLATAAE